MRLIDVATLASPLFAMDKNRVTLTPRLVKVGLTPDDPKLIQRIVNAGRPKADMRYWNVRKTPVCRGHQYPDDSRGRHVKDLG